MSGKKSTEHTLRLKHQFISLTCQKLKALGKLDYDGKSDIFVI